MNIPTLTFKNLGLRQSLFWLPIVLLCVVIALMPSQAYAIDFPTITGISATDDPITIGIKIAALIFKAIIFVIFASAFIAAAYVAVTTLLKMAKDRENAGDLVGRLMASLFVIIMVWWFADQGEQAADDLKDIQLSSVAIVNIDSGVV
jgi:hypothetical protein